MQQIPTITSTRSMVEKCSLFRTGAPPNKFPHISHVSLPTSTLITSIYHVSGRANRLVGWRTSNIAFFQFRHVDEPVLRVMPCGPTTTSWFGQDCYTRSQHLWFRIIQPVKWNYLPHVAWETSLWPVNGLDRQGILVESIAQMLVDREWFTDSCDMI